MLRRLVATAVGFLALLSAGGAAVAARPSAQPAPGRAGRIVVWVQNAPSNSVLPVDAGTHRPRTPVRVRDPFALAITPDGKTVYVSGLHSVVPINTTTGRAGKPVPIRHGGPGQIVVTPNGKFVYVAAGNTVVPIRVATNRAGKPIVVARPGEAPRDSG